jgi:uracil phosphoribosyltransferase
VEVMKGEIIIIPILRAGIAMLRGALGALPNAKVGFVGLKRNEETAIAQEYYWNLPELTNNSTIIITDPMLATGGSAHHVLKRINPLPHESIRVVCVVAAPEGIAKVHQDFPDVRIFAAAVDKGLNDKKYILPGLGDYGDRYMGTE